MGKYALFAKKGKKWIRVGQSNHYYGRKEYATRKKKELGGKLFGKKLSVRKIK